MYRMVAGETKSESVPFLPRNPVLGPAPDKLAPAAPPTPQRALPHPPEPQAAAPAERRRTERVEIAPLPAADAAKPVSGLDKFAEFRPLPEHRREFDTTGDFLPSHETHVVPVVTPGSKAALDKFVEFRPPPEYRLEFEDAKPFATGPKQALDKTAVQAAARGYRQEPQRPAYPTARDIRKDEPPAAPAPARPPEPKRPPEPEPAPTPRKADTVSPTPQKADAVTAPAVVAPVVPPPAPTPVAVEATPPLASTADLALLDQVDEYIVAAPPPDHDEALDAVAPAEGKRAALEIAVDAAPPERDDALKAATPADVRSLETQTLKAASNEAAPVEADLVEAAPLEAPATRGMQIEVASPALATVQAAPLEAQPIAASRIDPPLVEAQAVQASQIDAPWVEAAATKAQPSEALQIAAPLLKAASVAAQPSQTAEIETASVDAAPAESAPLEAAPVEVVSGRATPATAPPLEATPAALASVELAPAEVAAIDAPAEASSDAATPAASATESDPIDPPPEGEPAPVLESDTDHELVDSESGVVEIGHATPLTAAEEAGFVESRFVENRAAKKAARASAARSRAARTKLSSAAPEVAPSAEASEAALPPSEEVAAAPPPEDEADQPADRGTSAAGGTSLAVIAPAAEARLDEPGFVKQGRRRQRAGRAMRVLMGLGSLGLVVVLLAQGMTTYRNQLAAQVPQLKPLLVQACGVIGCVVDLPAQIDTLSIEQGELQTLAENKFSFVTVLRNQSGSAQVWPHLELTLTDGNDKAVLRRVFAPPEYLSGPAEQAKGFAARSESTVKLHFELAQLKASGYHIAIFYP